MQKLLIFIFLLAFGQLCAQSSNAKSTWSGNKFLNHTRKQGPKAMPGETVSVHLQSWMGDSLFISTRRDFGGPREVTIPAMDKFTGKRIPAVIEAVLQMTVGDSATIYEILDSAQIKKLPLGYENVSSVRYEIVAMKIFSVEDMRKKQEALEKARAAVQARESEVAQLVQTAIGDHKSKSLGDRLKKTESGLEYVMLQENSGPTLNPGDPVTLHYYGVLKSNGQKFDSSFERGEVASFSVGMLIPGLNEGLTYLGKGGKAVFFIPSALAYGAQGAGDAIPANADLVFYVEL